MLHGRIGTAPTASVVIPVHNAAQTLGAQLAALSRQRGAPAFQVVLVMNRSSDDSRAIADSWADHLDLVVLDADEKASASYARNVGARASTGDFVLFCDADDEVGPDWVASMVRPLAMGDADFVGGRIVVDQSNLPAWIYDLRYESNDGRCVQRPSGRLPYVMSASLGCRREALDDIGGFDESFAGAGYEEVDLAWRLLRAGFRIGEAADAHVLYRPRTSFREVMAQVRAYERGAVVLAAKEGGLVDPCSSRRGVVARMGKRMAHLIVRRREHRPRTLLVRAIEMASRLDAERVFVKACRADARSSRTPRRSTTDFLVPLDTPVVGGLGFEARSATAYWYAASGIEKRTMAIVEALLDDGDVFVDCGANIGVFTVAAAMCVGPRGRVIAFEPDPRSRTVLEENLRRHRVRERVEVRAEAVGRSRGRRRFLQYSNDTVSGFGTAPPTFEPGVVEAADEVDVFPLGDVVEGPVSIIKIDVEGFEPDVLNGAEAVLERSRDVALIVELNPTSLQAAGSTVTTLLELLPTDAWALWLIDDQTSDQTLGIRAVLRDSEALILSMPSSWYGNLLAVRKHRHREVAAIVEQVRG